MNTAHPERIRPVAALSAFAALLFCAGSACAQNAPLTGDMMQGQDASQIQPAPRQHVPHHKSHAAAVPAASAMPPAQPHPVSAPVPAKTVQSRLVPVAPAPAVAPVPPVPPVPPVAPVPPVPPASAPVPVAHGAPVSTLSDVDLDAPPPYIPVADTDRAGAYTDESGGYVAQYDTGFAVYRSSVVGAATRNLLQRQVEGSDAGAAQPALGATATATYKRYIDSFAYPIPEKFEHAVESSSSGSQ